MPKHRNVLQRLLVKLAAAGAFLAKFGALLLKVKYLGAVLSIGVSVVAYSLWFGWSFAAGFVALIFVHEMGHVVELRRQGVKASLPMFIPFLGAFVNMKQAPRSAFHEALSGLAGPYFGTAASVAVAFWGHETGSQFLLQLGAMGLFINLFNLLPMLPLDGGRAAAALHPALWLLGLVGLLAMVFFAFSPVLLLILVLGSVELWQRWTNRQSRQAQFYYALTAAQRASIGVLYVLVMAVAAVGFDFTYVGRQL
ncbi:MAG TPA: site-2 protease family protein [Acidimicrobiales bacterium]|nr:site-2 protease family protein [Acidimicrobiales bacterium]